MNANRRKAIKLAISHLQGLKERLEKLSSELQDEKQVLEELRDEEQEYFDNMPEGLKNGEKGENAEASISALDSMCNELDSCETYLDDINSSLENAINSVDDIN
jgi:DNA repair exonuclease SbcCD ATPase subunit